MNRIKTRALNYAKLNNLSQAEQEKITEHAQEIIDGLQPLVNDYQAAHNDVNLSSTGRQAAGAQITEAMVDTTAKISRADKLAEQGQRLSADSINQVVQAENKHNQADIAAALDRQAILTFMPAAEEKAKKEHAAYLAKAKADNIPLTDKQKAYTGPTVDNFLRACEQGINAETAPYLHTCRHAPFPVQLVSDLVLAEGQRILEQVQSPELSQAIESNRHYQAAYTTMLDSAGEIIAKPMSAV